MSEINTRINLTETATKFYKRFKKLSINETPKLQGDGNISISPFDDYFVFTLYAENNGEDIPLDLINVGDLYLTFTDNNDTIRIKNVSNVEDISPELGEILFKINQADGEKILNLDTRIFYISSKQVIQDFESDESVIYTGTFSSSVESAKEYMTDLLENQRIEFSNQLDLIDSDNRTLRQEVSNLTQIVAELNSSLTQIRLNNDELINELFEINKDLQSSTIEARQRLAQEIQANAEVAQKQAMRILAKSKTSEIINNTKQIETLSKVNQKYMI